MIKLLKQLFIERLLSGAIPYIAFHPELGVPVGVFNYKDEPDHQSRVRSIKRYGTKGNPLSYNLATQNGISNPIPSYAITPDVGDFVAGKGYYKGVDALGNAVYDASGISRRGSGGGTTTGGLRYLEEMAQVRTPKGRMGPKEMEEMMSIMKNGIPSITAMETHMSSILEMVALEDTLRLGISQKLGMSNEQLFDTIDNMNAGGIEMAKFGISADQLYETFEKIGMTIGRNLTIPQETINRATLLEKTFQGLDMAAMSDAFDTVGYSLEGAIGGVDETDNAMSEIIQTGREFGVVMETFLGSMAGELKLINTYGFERGVEGLSRMVARGQSLGLEMGKVTSLAENFLDPEGAIDFAAQMQVIGGAVGDLSDPFKLMYMATNDLEGLQEAIIDTAAASATFDTETNKFIISPGSRRQLRDQAKAMGMDYQELADLAVKSARRAAVFSELEFVGDMSETDKELIASMASIGENGTAQVKIPGIEEMVNVADLTEEQMEKLRKDGMSDSDIYGQQLTAAEKANQYLAAMDGAMRVMAKSFGGDDRKILMKSFSQTMAGKMELLDDAQLDILASGDPEAISKMMGDLKTEMGSDMYENVMKPALKVLGLGEVERANDFVLRPGKPAVKFNEDDLIIGGTKLEGELGMGDINNRNETLNTVVNEGNTNITKGTDVPLLVEGTIKLEGNNESANIDVDRLIKQLSTGNVQQLKRLLQTKLGTG